MVETINELVRGTNAILQSGTDQHQGNKYAERMDMTPDKVRNLEDCSKSLFLLKHQSEKTIAIWAILSKMKWLKISRLHYSCGTTRTIGWSPSCWQIEKKMFASSFGLDDGKMRTLEDVGKVFNDPWADPSDPKPKPSQTQPPKQKTAWLYRGLKILRILQLTKIRWGKSSGPFAGRQKFIEVKWQKGSHMAYTTEQN